MLTQAIRVVAFALTQLLVYVGIVCAHVVDERLIERQLQLKLFDFFKLKCQLVVLYVGLNGATKMINKQGLFLV